MPPHNLLNAPHKGFFNIPIIMHIRTIYFVTSKHLGPFEVEEKFKVLMKRLSCHIVYLYSFQSVSYILNLQVSRKWYIYF